MILVLKANAYGHGAVLAAKVAEKSGMSMVAVARISEGKELREAGITLPILLIGGTLPQQADEIVRYGLQPSVYTEDQLKALGKAGREQGKKVKVHIKVDTGMRRTGIADLETLDALLSVIQQNPYLECAGMFTHYAMADECGNTFTYDQYARFMTFAEHAHHKGYYPLLHANNTAATQMQEVPALDAARVGIGLYGMKCCPTLENADLQPVLGWKTVVVAINHLHPGDRSGYGQHFEAQRETILATLPVGYADGYRRDLSRKGYVLINGQKAPLAGNVCMDHIMVDVTDISNVQIGTPATLIGKDGEEEIIVDDLCKIYGVFNYELTSCITLRINRVLA